VDVFSKTYNYPPLQNKTEAAYIKKFHQNDSIQMITNMHSFVIFQLFFA